MILAWVSPFKSIVTLKYILQLPSNVEYSMAAAGREFKSGIVRCQKDFLPVPLTKNKKVWKCGHGP